MKPAQGAPAAAACPTVAPLPSSALQQLYNKRRAPGPCPSEEPTSAAVATRPHTRQRSAVPGKVWVGGLSAATDAGSLEAAFRPHGEVLDARVLYDGHGHERQSRGYGFVTYVEPESVAPAIRAMDGAVVDGSTVRVNEVFKNDVADGQHEANASVRKRPTPASQKQQSIAGSSTGPASSLTSASPVLMVPAQHIGLVIGRGGSTIRQISSESGATLKVAPAPIDNTSTGPDQRKLELAGLPHQIQAARRLVLQLLARIPKQADTPPSGISRRTGTNAKPLPETIIAGYINDAPVDEGEWW